MIKLVASDLDGTLLTPDKRLPEEIFGLIEKLYDKGIIFTPASGRQLPNLQKLFAPVIDKIAIIAENGGIVWHKGEIIYINPTPSDEVKSALEIIKKERGLYPLLSCPECAYFDDDNPLFLHKLEEPYTSRKQVDNLLNIAGNVRVIKISIWDEFAPCSEHGGPVLTSKIKGSRTIVSGYEWMDVSVATANKGEALKALINHLKLSSEECEAYGDHMNDLEMLTVCGSPYVPENAFEGIKKIIKNRIPSNAEYGVIQKLKELCK